jgi:AcrR family transcriptional regulator
LTIDDYRKIVKQYPEGVHRATGPADRLTRADRILDAAATLLQRWGYRRLTMDDVAREARIGKGTIYLHWNTRESLFRAVLQREVLVVLGALERAIEADPRNALPHRLGAVYFEAIMARPLVHAMFRMDQQVLGSLVDDRGQDLAELGRVRLDFVRFLQEAGVVRSDIPPEDLSYAFRSLLLGFVLADSLLGHEHTTRRKSDVLALLLRSALEAVDAPPDGVVLAVAERVRALLAHAQTDGARLLGQLARAGLVQPPSPAD